MWLHKGEVESTHQPVPLFTGQSDQCIVTIRPMEAFFTQRFVLQDEAVVFLEQTFDFVSLSVSENIQCATERVVLQVVLNQYR